MKNKILFIVMFILLFLIIISINSKVNGYVFTCSNGQEVDISIPSGVDMNKPYLLHYCSSTEYYIYVGINNDVYFSAGRISGIGVLGQYCVVSYNIQTSTSVVSSFGGSGGWNTANYNTLRVFSTNSTLVFAEDLTTNYYYDLSVYHNKINTYFSFDYDDNFYFWYYMNGYLHYAYLNGVSNINEIYIKVGLDNKIKVYNKITNELINCTFNIKVFIRCDFEGTNDNIQSVSTSIMDIPTVAIIVSNINIYNSDNSVIYGYDTMPTLHLTGKLLDENYLYAYNIYSDWLTFEQFNKYKLYSRYYDTREWENVFFNEEKTEGGIKYYRNYLTVYSNETYYFRYKNIESNEFGSIASITVNILSPSVDKDLYYRDNERNLTIQWHFEKIDADTLHVCLQGLVHEKYLKYDFEYYDLSDTFYRDMSVKTTTIIETGETLYYKYIVCTSDNTYVVKVSNRETGEVKTAEIIVDFASIMKDLNVGETKKEQTIWDKIVDFIFPDSDFFTSYISDLNGYFGDRFGIIYYPIELLVDFFNRIIISCDNFNIEPVISFNNIELFGSVVIPAYSFNFNDLLENETFSNIYNIYLLVVDVILYLGLTYLSYNIFVEIFGGRFIDGFMKDMRSSLSSNNVIGGKKK